MPDFQFFDFLIVGSISTEFIIDLRNHPHQDVIGGSALYAAGGLRCWKDRIAVLSHTHAKNQIPLENLHKKYQIDFEGVQIQKDIINDRNFLGYVSPYETINENPVAFYASRGLAFPKNLIGYFQNGSTDQVQNKPKYLPEDIPPHYWDITAALLCHSDINTQIQISSMLQKASAKILVVQSCNRYMKMSNYETMPVLMKDITAFITTEAQLSTLFQNRSQDIWEMAEHLCSLGCEQVIIEDGHFGQYLYDHRTQKRFHVPMYPVNLIDPTGILESFCGGYLAGIKKNFDPLEALLWGTVSASFTGEGTGPFYGVDSVPGLIQSRFNFASELVKNL